MAPKKRERIFIDGARFEAAVSPNGKYSDIKDKSLGGLLILIDKSGMRDLWYLLDWLLGEEELPPQIRFTAYLSDNKEFADIFDFKHHAVKNGEISSGYLRALDRKAISELSLLVEELTVMMAD